jgi:lysophospholipase L1-like esterase
VAIPRRRKLGYALLAAVLVLGGTETALRLTDFSFYYNFGADLLGMPLLELNSVRRTMNRTVEFDPDLFWRFKPNQTLDAHGVYLKPVHINAHGFRGADWPEQKPAGTYRIACLGDSSTFGWSVGDDETYPAQLAALLNVSSAPRRVEVLNLGVTGYSSFQGRELMLRSVAAWKPDLVVFAFGPNDRLPALKSDAEHQRDRTWDIGQITACLSRLQLYQLAKAGVVYLKNRRQGLTLDPKTYIPRLKRKVSPEEYMDNVRRVKQACAAIDADLILISVDYPSQPPDAIDGELRKQSAEHGAQMPAGWMPWDGAALNARLASELNVPWLDLRTRFTDELEPRQETWEALMVDNGHPNRRGHELIAHWLATKIQARP